MKPIVRYDGARTAVERTRYDDMHSPEYGSNLRTLKELYDDYDKTKRKCLAAMSYEIGDEADATVKAAKLSESRKIRRLLIFRHFPSTPSHWGPKSRTHIDQLRAIHSTSNRLAETLRSHARELYHEEVRSLVRIVSSNVAVMDSIACASPTLLSAILKLDQKLPKNKLVKTLHNYYIKSAYKVTPNNGLCLLSVPSTNKQEKRSIANVDIALSYLNSRSKILSDNNHQSDPDDELLDRKYSPAPSFNHGDHKDWLVRTVQYTNSRPYATDSLICGLDLDSDLDPTTVMNLASEKTEVAARNNLKTSIIMNLVKPRSPSQVDQNPSDYSKRDSCYTINHLMDDSSSYFDITNLTHETVSDIAIKYNKIGLKLSEQSGSVSGSINNILRFDSIEHQQPTPASEKATAIISSQADVLKTNLFLSNEYIALHQMVTKLIKSDRASNLLQLICQIFSDSEAMSTIEAARRTDMLNISGESRIRSQNVGPTTIAHTVRPSTTYALELFDTGGNNQVEGVLNQTFHGAGSLLARYSHESKDLSLSISNWVKSIASTDNCAILTPNRDCDNSLARLDLSVPVYDWITSSNQNSMNFFNELNVEIGNDEALQILHEGRETSVIPFSLRPLWTYNGPFRLFWRFFDPWIDRSLPSLDSTGRFYGVTPITGYTARVSSGPLVLRRAKYTISVGALRNELESVLQCQLYLFSLFDSIGMGETCFYVAYRFEPNSPASKPSPLVLSSSLSVSRFIGDVKEANCITFTEMLPAAKDGAPEIKSEHYVSAMWTKGEMTDRPDI